MLCLDCAWTGKVCEPNDNGVHSSVLRIYVIMYVCVSFLNLTMYLSSTVESKNCISIRLELVLLTA